MVWGSTSTLSATTPQSPHASESRVVRDPSSTAAARVYAGSEMVRAREKEARGEGPVLYGRRQGLGKVCARDGEGEREKKGCGRMVKKGV